jgi:glycosyltransferase involved in cell wall biosynthesis
MTLADSQIKVSVAMITYNHEKYIAKALDGVLMQRTNFDYEIIIGEDCSTDNTRNIIVDYEKRYPGRFRLFLNEKNLSMHKNAGQVHGACNGKYVAVCEGDDYWTSPLKLQKQVDFLDSHPECAICFHNASIVYKDGSRDPRNYCRDDQKEISTLEDILVEDFIPTCSTMYRRGLISEGADWVSSVINGDWAGHILTAQHGKIGYINEIMAAFRSHPGGVWSRLSKEEVYMALIKFYETLKAHAKLGFNCRRIILRMLVIRCLELSAIYEDKGEMANAKIYARWCLTRHFLIRKIIFKTILRLYTPALYKFLRSAKRVSRYAMGNR